MRNSVIFSLVAGVTRYLDQAEVDIALAKISFATGIPVRLFQDDALRWCSERPSKVSHSLEYAASEVAAGRKLPWVQEETA